MQFAMLFPGQGSQAVGMLGELAREFPVVRETFDEGSEALSVDLWALAQAGPEAEINRTERTQPVLLAASVATWRAWRVAGGTLPVAMAGHSLGEYSALVCAEALNYGDAVRLVAQRGQAMQAAVAEGQGGMAAIVGLSDDQVRELCRQAAAGEVLEAVNFNAPGQVVIAGQRSAVESAIGRAKGAGAKLARLLAVSVPSHSSLMIPASERLRDALTSITVNPPRLPVLHNLDSRSREAPEDIRAVLLAQLHNPVLWADTVRQLAADGASLMLECGPGRVLTGLNRRIDKSVRALALSDTEGLRQGLELTQQD